ncbi:MAG: hypothetical protein QNK92_04790 [Amylibacter sp.]
MTNAQHFMDEDLSAFLDGEADDALVQAITAALETDRALEARLAFLDVPMQALRAGFDGLLGQAPAMPVIEIPKIAPLIAANTMKHRWGGWAAAAAVLLAFGVGAYGGYSYEKPVKLLTWMQAAANYQTLYVNYTLDVASPKVTDAQAQLARISQSVGQDSSGVQAIDGLDFKRAQVLGYNAKPLGQIAYVNAKGEPMALCVIKISKSVTQDIVVQKMSGLAAAHWKADGYAYLLIGGSDQAAVETWAKVAQTNIQKKAPQLRRP